MHTHNKIDNGDVHAQAAAWVMKVQEGLSSDDQSAFDAWISADPSHVEVFARQSAMMHAPLDEAHKLGFESAPVPVSRSMSVFHGVKPWWVGAGVAAAALMVSVVSLGSVFDGEPIPEPTLADNGAAPIYQTAYHDIQTENLDDGSTLWIDAQSQVTVHYTAQVRQLDLDEGGVFVDVQSNPERPFTVNAGAVSFTALGTAYEVQARDGGYHLIVEEGVVEVRDGRNAQTFSVEAGQSALWQADGDWQRFETDRWGAALWREERVAFDRQNFADVLTVINRYREQPLMIGDNRLKTVPVSGVFSLDFNDPESMVAALSLSVGARTQTLSDGRTVFLAASSE